MKKVILFLLFIPFISYAQKKGLANKRKLVFETGLEHRITPIFNSVSFIVSDNFSSFVDPTLQNAGFGLNFGMEYFFSDNFSVGLMTTFRYDFIVSGATTTEADFGVAPNTFGLLLDHHLTFNYHFKVFEKGNFFISAGFSRINTNSNFTSISSFFDDDDNLIGTIFSIEDFGYWASRYEIGYIKDKYKIGIGITSSNNTNYFNETTSFIVPFAKFSFLFGK